MVRGHLFTAVLGEANQAFMHLTNFLLCQLETFFIPSVYFALNLPLFLPFPPDPLRYDVATVL